MYKLIEWDKDLDLSEFYDEARKKGYCNNDSHESMIKPFDDVDDVKVFILYYNDNAVGSVVAHSFPEMGENSYRICARTCVLTDKIPTNTLRTRNQIITHQHVTGQFLIPACVEWAGKENNLYITSNNLEGGSQRLVHNVYFPAMEKSGQVEYIKDMKYRGTTQSVWKLNVEKFYHELNKHPRWI